MQSTSTEKLKSIVERAERRESLYLVAYQASPHFVKHGDDWAPLPYTNFCEEQPRKLKRLRRSVDAVLRELLG